MIEIFIDRADKCHFDPFSLTTKIVEIFEKWHIKLSGVFKNDSFKRTKIYFVYYYHFFKVSREIIEFQFFGSFI